MTRPTHRWYDLPPALGALALGALVFAPGVGSLVFHIYAAIVAGTLFVSAILRGVALGRGQLVKDWMQKPFAPENRSYLGQLIVRLLFFLLWSALVVPPTAELVVFIDPSAKTMIFVGSWVSVILMALFCVFPRQRVPIATNAAFALGIIAVLVLGIPPMFPKAGEVEIAYPLQRTGVVFQGGRGILVNHHYNVGSQRDALDLVTINENDRMSATEMPGLLDYDCFGQPVFAPASGRVVRAVNDRPDAASFAEIDPAKPAGNHVAIEMEEERYVLIAHLKEGSVVVSEGEDVTVGAPIGQCGNSGNTTMPHLHLQVSTLPDVLDPATRTFRMKFTNVTPAERLVRGHVLRYSSSSRE